MAGKQALLGSTSVIQSHAFIDAARDLIDSAFSYDLAFPGEDEDDMHTEVNEVVEELILHDIYRLSQIARRGDVWVDAGCHVGIFSIAVMQAGAEVLAAFDIDAGMERCARHNLVSFNRQARVRGMVSDHIVPRVIGRDASRPEALVAASFLPGEVWDQRQRACLKVDIQGAELALLDNGGAKQLAEAYDLLVMEWHHEQDVYALLEDGGWQITNIQSHVDVLLNCPTRIVWARSG